MGKEFKIGLAVVSTVAIAFGGILYQRVNKLKTTPAVARNEQAVGKEASKADRLFATTNQLDTVSGDKANAADGQDFKWNSKPSEEPAAEHVAVEAAPPRASFLPKEEPASDDRYGSPYADTNSSAPLEEPAVNEPATEAAPAEDAPIGRIVADTQHETATEESAPLNDATEPPSSVANPFARTSPAAAAPAASEPADAAPIAVAPMPEEPLSEPATDRSNAEQMVADAPARELEQPRSIAIVQPDEQVLPSEPAKISIASEPTPPARLDTRTVPTGAISESRRPTSRFIPSEVEAPPASAGSRYSDSFAEPAPRAPSPAAANAIAGGTYRLGPNENFWTVSEQAYGTGGYFKALHASNAERHPIADDLAVGDEIRVPEKSELERQFPELCPKPGRRSTRDSYAIQASAKMKASGETYVVQEGDTLFDIARYELGKAARWAELYELNREAIGNDIDFLRPGMELILPNDGARGDSVTRQPGGSLR